MSAVAIIARVEVSAGGGPLDADLITMMDRVVVQERLSAPTLCELTFSDSSDLLARVSSGMEPGTALRVATADADVPLFDGEVTAVEHVYGPAHGREVRVRGYDLLHRLRKNQQVKAHVQTTLEDLAGELAGAAGLSVDAEESGPMWRRLIQYQTDYDLLLELAERCGLYLTVREGVLHVITLEGLGDPVPLELGTNLFEVRIETNGDPACRSVSSSGWDTLAAEAHQGSVGSARVGRDIGAEVAPEDVGGSGELSLVDENAPDDDHAEGLAQAELDARVAREVTLWGIAEGDPRLQPGAIVEVSGVDPELKGTYVLTSVTHTIDAERGFVSEISTMPPDRRSRPRATVTSLAEVTDVGDPDGLGRVKVKLSTFEDVETDWMGVLVPGAGSGKGLIVLPDVGDQVLVLLSHQDPGQGLVLGGLYGTTAPPDPGVEGGAVRRYTFTTPGGQWVRLDDDKKLVRMEDSSGNSIELSPDGVVIHSIGKFTVDAAGQAVVIRGKSIDLETA